MTRQTDKQVEAEFNKIFNKCARVIIEIWKKEDKIQEDEESWY